LVIHFHFHSRVTGVTKSIESIFPVILKHTDARVFGYGINLPRIGLLSLLKMVYSAENHIVHTHRNNEILFALLLRMLGAKFRLVFTRHAESTPSGFTIYLMRKADVLVSLTRTMSASLPIKNIIVRHGVDTEFFNIGEKKNIDGIPQTNLITVIGRVRPAKGQLLVMKALAPLLRKYSDWGLIIIGKIDKREYSDEILSVARLEDVVSQVHFIAETGCIADYYHASTVVVIASSSEGFSLVCLEAPACGIITVATEGVGVHSEVLTHGKNGFLFPPGDEEALRGIIEGIIDKELVISQSVIRQNITDNWNLEKTVQALLKVYGVK